MSGRRRGGGEWDLIGGGWFGMQGFRRELRRVVLGREDKLRDSEINREISF